MLKFHVTMVVIILQKSQIVIRVIIYMTYLWIARYVANSLLDLKFTMTSNTCKIATYGYSSCNIICIACSSS